jgi:hypothetical protein
MRSQPGTESLRALVYFDEVVGFVPPTAVPPAKGPILTLLKQARAFGVGMVLATQNPVDLDYKALSNAGTWAIGRLQTEQDKGRLLDGLAAAAGGVDVDALSRTIAALDQREFVLRQADDRAAITFTSRWAMSYLRGPLTRDQIAGLMADRRQATARSAGSTPGKPPAPADSMPADATPVMPTVADGLSVGWLDPAAPWGSAIGADPASSAHVPALMATVDLLFDDRKVDLRHTETVEVVLHPLADPIDPGALVLVDHDVRDVRAEPPETATYRLADAPIGKPAFAKAAQKALVDHLVATRSVALSVNRELDLVSRPGETSEAFAARCEAAADACADAAVAALAKRYDARVQRARAALATAQDRVEQAEATQQARHADELVSGAGDLLGSILGGRRGARSMAGTAGSIARRRGRSSEAGRRVEAATNRASEKAEALADIEADLADEVTEITAAWDAKGLAIEAVEVPLERTDVRVTGLTLLWVPV